METLQALWAALNSPIGIAAVAAVVVFILNKLYARKPLWEKWEGTIISAVKMAEKMVPDDSENKSVRRLDAALDYVIKVFEEAEDRKVKTAEKAELKEGIQIVHNYLAGEHTLAEGG